jgi:hypothetical protein
MHWKRVATANTGMLKGGKLKNRKKALANISTAVLRFLTYSVHVSNNMSPFP